MKTTSCNTVRLSLPEFALRISNLYTAQRITSDTVAEVLARETPACAAYLACAVTNYLSPMERDTLQTALARRAGYIAEVGHNQNYVTSTLPKL